MNTILKVTGLRKNFGRFGLTDVNFSLKEDCITGFIGLNGAGKTTTIKAILGLILKDAGNIQIFGQDMAQNERKLKDRIGVVMDEGYFYEEITIHEMKSILAPAYSHWDEEIFQGLLDRFALNPKQKIATLSKGMRMKYALTLALSHHADLLVMDEPTSGLDPLVRRELMDILLEFMAQGGKGVFFSTHITSDIEKVADVLILIDHGRIVFNEEKDILLDQYGLVKGDKSVLDNQTRKLFLTLRETAYGFEGITKQKNSVRRQIKDVLIEKPTIEDIMLAHIGGDHHAA
jgi:ABC-2 type transport system ATP-binding protein